MYLDSSRSKKSPLRRVVLLLMILALGVVGLAVWRVGPAPDVSIRPLLSAIGPSTEVEIEGSEPVRGLVSLTIELIQGDRIWQVDRRAYSPRPFWQLWGDATFSDRWKVRVGKDAQKDLLPGPARIRVTAERAGTWLRRPDPGISELEMQVELTPPDLTVESASSLVRQGGSGLVIYRVGERATRHGLRMADREIQGFDLEGGYSFLIFGVPQDLGDAPSQMRLFAEDALGNRVEQRFLRGFSSRTFPEDDIEVSDGFLEDVVPEILAHTPEIREKDSLLESYLEINSRLRADNARALTELSESSAPDFLWRGVFSQMPSSRAMAGFGDRRTYMYQGRAVDEQVHLGYDLASHRRAEVPAANGGRVVLAEYFGIYGKTVVVDHGFGLVSLYSHLSEITAKVGDEVGKGTTLGRTGTTGLAGGDHLHFSVLIHGVQVNPLEWWDERWIENHILFWLREARVPID